jgi:hypothetical protein
MGHVSRVRREKRSVRRAKREKVVSRRRHGQGVSLYTSGRVRPIKRLVRSRVPAAAANRPFDVGLTCCCSACRVPRGAARVEPREAALRGRRGAARQLHHLTIDAPSQRYVVAKWTKSK